MAAAAESENDEISEVRRMGATLDSVLGPQGFESGAFLAGWYNAKVAAGFQLPCAADTLCFCVMNTPWMFETTFLPFLRGREQGAEALIDPIDECVRLWVGRACEALRAGGVTPEPMYDFDMDPRWRRARVLVQTAGHVAGLAYYYRPQDVRDQSLVAAVGRSLYGCSLHPRFGGWFAFRAVIVCHNRLCPALPPRAPPDPLQTDEAVVRFLELFTRHWKDARFRDALPVEQRYSQLQRTYFETLPKHRPALLNGWLEQGLLSSNAA